MSAAASDGRSGADRSSAPPDLPPAQEDRPQAQQLEIEAKFYVPDLEGLAALLEERGARTTRQRHLERNWRFDLPDRSLSEAGVVLRLRTDPRATLTLKRPRRDVLARDEYEVEVGQAVAAQAILEQLGYELIAVYEKVRTEYTMAESAIMLDELPFGNFVELEGPSGTSVKGRAVALGLDWERRVPHTYLDLFGQLKQRLGLEFRDATFDNFAEQPEVRSEDLQVADAFVQEESG